jgi:hypothetical protein
MPAFHRFCDLFAQLGLPAGDADWAELVVQLNRALR